MNGYDIFQGDRNREGGVVALNVTTGINAYSGTDLIPGGLEAICLQSLKNYETTNIKVYLCLPSPLQSNVACDEQELLSYNCSSNTQHCL